MRSEGKRTQSDSMDTRNFLYMFYGFAVAWLAVVLYVLVLVSRERRLRDELSRLRTMIDSGDRK